MKKRRLPIPKRAETGRDRSGFWAFLYDYARRCRYTYFLIFNT